MRLFLRGVVSSLAVILVATPAFAQASSDADQLAAQGGRFSLSPYLGMVLPTADLLTLAKSSGTGTQDIKLTLFGKLVRETQADFERLGRGQQHFVGNESAEHRAGGAEKRLPGGLFGG